MYQAVLAKGCLVHTAAHHVAPARVRMCVYMRLYVYTCILGVYACV